METFAVKHADRELTPAVHCWRPTVDGAREATIAGDPLCPFDSIACPVPTFEVQWGAAATTPDVEDFAEG